MSKPVITEWPDKWVDGAKRCNLDETEYFQDWFIGTGKDESCYLEGTWWDMICLARNILASENTRIACPEWHHPEYEIDHYLGGEPYEFNPKREMPEEPESPATC